jgi:ankyrin repeat protein
MCTYIQTLYHAASRAGNTKALLTLFNFHKKQQLNEHKLNNVQEQQHLPPADIEARDRWHRTCVHWSVLNGHVDTLKCLLDHGAQVNTAGKTT